MILQTNVNKLINYTGKKTHSQRRVKQNDRPGDNDRKNCFTFQRSVKCLRCQRIFNKEVKRHEKVVNVIYSVVEHGLVLPSWEKRLQKIRVNIIEGSWELATAIFGLLIER